MDVKFSVEAEVNQVTAPPGNGQTADGNLPQAAPVPLAPPSRVLPFPVFMHACFGGGGWFMWLLAASSTLFVVTTVLFPAPSVSMSQRIMCNLLVGGFGLLIYVAAVRRFRWGVLVMTALTDGVSATGEVESVKRIESSRGTPRSTCFVTYRYNIDGLTRTTIMHYGVPYQHTPDYHPQVELLVVPGHPECVVVLPHQQPETRWEDTDFFRIDAHGQIGCAPYKGMPTAVLICLPIILTAILLTISILKVYGWCLQR